MEDIAILTGGKCITEDLGIKLETISLDDLGCAKIHRGGKGKHHDRGRPAKVRGTSRAAVTTASAARSRKPPSRTTAKKLQERLAKLAGGVAVINAGAATETEMKVERRPAWKTLCTRPARRLRKASSSEAVWL